MNEPRRRQAITVLQATEAAPTLGRLVALAARSGEWLDLVKPLLPATLRDSLRPGPIDGTQWCLLVPNNAVAAKVRQLLPALAAHLRTKGCEVTAIRLKVQT